MPLHLGDFTEGQTFESPGRTITEADIVGFAAITGDWNPVHTNAEFARATPIGERIAHGPMAIGMMFGLLSRLDLFDGSVLALKSIEWTFDAPMRIGDTVRVIATVAAVTPHPSTAERGRVTMDAQFLNQHDVPVSNGRFTVVIKA